MIPDEPIGPICWLPTQWSRDRKQSYVYAIRCEETGRFKIGISVNPENRWRSLRLLSSTRTVLVGHCFGNGVVQEQHIHDVLTDHRVHGEWYRPVPAVLNVVQDIVNGGMNLYVGSPVLTREAVAA